MSDLEQFISKHIDKSKQYCKNVKKLIPFERSFAAHQMSHYWSIKNEISCRDVFKSSIINFKFNCYKCSHEFEIQPTYIKNVIWCGLCGNNKLYNDNRPICIEVNCFMEARYNIKDDYRRIYCCKHAKNYGGMFDKSKKLCKICNNDYATYNYKNVRGGQYCLKCKLPNMVSNKIHICQFEDCIVEAYYNIPAIKQGKFCFKHCNKLIMVNVKSKRCESCGIYQVRRSSKICSYCNPNSHKKIKEQIVVNFIKNNNIDFIHDKRIQSDEFGIHRPDILINCLTYYIVVEVDEFQHKCYNKDDELQRMFKINKKLQMPILFIRFNPDEFKYNNITSIIDLTFKLEMLIKYIKMNINISNLNEDIQLIYMYYDCNCKTQCNYIHNKKFEL